MLINKSDFACVGDVAVHCDLQKLCIAINEAQDFDLAKLFCDFWYDVLKFAKEVEEYQVALVNYNKCVDEGGEDCAEPVKPINYELKNNLINGGSYTGCNGREKTHKGVKRVLTYYAYSRYVILNGFNDTPNGNVSKANDFSIPKSMAELKMFGDKYRTMGHDVFKDVLDFLCHNKDVFEGAKCLPCNTCGCGCADCGGTVAKGYGIKGRNIVRRVC